MILKDLSRSSSDLLHDIGMLTTQVADNRTLLVLTRTVTLVSLLVDEVKRIDKLVTTKY